MLNLEVPQTPTLGLIYDLLLIDFSFIFLCIRLFLLFFHPLFLIVIFHHYLFFHFLITSLLTFTFNFLTCFSPISWWSYSFFHFLHYFDFFFYHYFYSFIFILYFIISVSPPPPPPPPRFSSWLSVVALNTVLRSNKHAVIAFYMSRNQRSVLTDGVNHPPRT